MLELIFKLIFEIVFEVIIYKTGYYTILMYYKITGKKVSLSEINDKKYLISCFIGVLVIIFLVFIFIQIVKILNL